LTVFSASSLTLSSFTARHRDAGCYLFPFQKALDIMSVFPCFFFPSLCGLHLFVFPSFNETPSLIFLFQLFFSKCLPPWAYPFFVHPLFVFPWSDVVLILHLPPFPPHLTATFFAISLQLFFPPLQMPFGVRIFFFLLNPQTVVGSPSSSFRASTSYVFSWNTR